MSRRSDPIWAPGEEDYQQVLLEQNPWHLDGKVPDVWAHPVERPLARALWRRLQVDEPRRFQLILGPRRVGKTTVMYQTVRRLVSAGVPARRLWWLRLDHPLLMRVRLDELVRRAVSHAGATQEEPVYLFLDELAYARDWDLWLKTFYDETWPVRLVGSSSATAALRERRLESGVGRWEEQYLTPYLFAEYLELSGEAIRVPVGSCLSETLSRCTEQHLPYGLLRSARRRLLLLGGFPEILAEANSGTSDEASALLHSQRTLRGDAVERAIYKDIPQAFGVDNPMLLERLLYTLAGQMTGMLSPSGISRSLDGLSQPTIDRYLAYLERAFIVFTLANYSGSELARQKRGRKLYFVDGAVRNAALQRGITLLSDTAEMGLLLENLAAGHLHALGQHSQVRVYHWRDKDEEVDLVYDHPESPVAFEIAASGTHQRGGLKRFAERFPRFRGRCFLVAPEVLPRLPSEDAGGVGTLPLDLLLLGIGAQVEVELNRRLAVAAG